MTVSVSLGPRLLTVASFVPDGAKLGDIGTDHAYLPIYLYETKRIIKAIGVDVHEGPYQSALSAVRSRWLEAVIDVRFGDGLKPLKPGEVDALTLAGMGGKTMLEILFARMDVLEAVSELVVQPQGAEGAVRLALLEHGWRLRTERLIEEEGRIYVVMAYSKTEGWNAAELQNKEQEWVQRLRSTATEVQVPEDEFLPLVHHLVWNFGPLVLEERSMDLERLLLDYSLLLSKRMDQMKKAKRIEITSKIKSISFEKALVEGLRRWR